MKHEALGAFSAEVRSQIRHEKCSCKRKGEQFIEEMKELAPWVRLILLVESYYPKQGNGSRPVGPEIMLRSYFDSPALRRPPGLEQTLRHNPMSAVPWMNAIGKYVAQERRINRSLS